MTERWEDTDGTSGGANNGLTIEGAEEVAASAGPTGTRVATTADSDTSVGQSLALNPGTSGGGGAPTIAADLAWTATPSTFAEGYVLGRYVGAALDGQQVITPRTVTSTIDTPLAAGTAYTYRLHTTYESWTSTTVSDTLTTVAC